MGEMGVLKQASIEHATSLQIQKVRCASLNDRHDSLEKAIEDMKMQLLDKEGVDITIGDRMRVLEKKHAEFVTTFAQGELAGGTPRKVSLNVKDMRSKDRAAHVAER